MAGMSPSNSTAEKDCPNCKNGKMHLWDIIHGDTEIGQVWFCEDCEYEEEPYVSEPDYWEEGTQP